ncbi:hybrid fatty acyl-AMP ligase/type I polyketide synthase [Pleurocapsa sp. FMAR1]|uniref:hybrid fatty acyl-AMP ligase/type I polyketide synthase n=1 Tax=Pleurocapsa sp. FMAR1 TaxID=3040204 RepID=UPI0029C7E0D6|nr:hybrid fatty acyl-AMP ligase/type I polyketide synthase [Pleurocapsa sp. FMAR1]
MSKQITLVERLQEQASIQPDKRAFTFLADGETEIDSLTYQQLNEKAKAIASVLQSYNAQGQRALLLYQPGLDFITAFLGCLYAGVVAVPVYPPRANRSLERLRAIITDAEASFALTTKLIQDQIVSKFANHNASSKVRFIATDTFELNLSSAWHHPEITTRNLAFLQYTSGSTGKPKGVMVSHGNLMANSAAIEQYFQNKREHNLVSWLPPYHDMGLIGSIIQPAYVGSSMYLLAPVTFLQRPYRWLQAISRYRGVTNGGPNFAYDLCVDRITPEQKANLDLSCWELAFSGAEPVRAKTIERFSEYFRDCGFRTAAFYPCYGMAESTLMIIGGDKHQEPVTASFENQKLEENLAVSTSSAENKTTLVSSGRNLPGQRLVIVNPQTLTKCSDGEIGEIWAKSDSIAQGYWGLDQLTTASFNAVLADTQEAGWLRTGDLGFLQAGELFVTGRLKDLIIIRGRNYYPQDIELTLDLAHEAIRAGNVAAFAVEVAGEEKLVVTAEIKRTYLRKLDVNEVTKAIRQAVAQNHELQIHAIVLLKTGSIPKTSSGKIQRHACEAGYLDGSLNTVGEYKSLEENGRLPQQNNGSGRGLQGLDAGSSLSPSVSPDRGVSRDTFVGRVSRLEKSVEPEGRNAPTGFNQKQNQIQNWLIENLAQRIGISASEIDIYEPFASSGLNSLAAVSLSADLEDWLDIKLSPTIVYDYPNIAELAVYLANDRDVQSGRTAVRPYELPNIQSDIAIIGVGCRFPGANDPAQFWQLLRDGKDAIAKSDRWSGSSWGGFIEDVDRFDPQFFGITPREAQSIDPQQRLLLEVSWSALEDAAVGNKNLAGSNTGVFIGISSSDYSQLRFHYGLDVDAYVGTGNAHSIAANRLSYLFDLKGPSMAVDTACSSSLVAIHLASQSLKTGECNLAIAGGVNLMLSPELTQTFTQAGMMAEDGRCKTFDADADGYVRGEGCGVVILKRLADAQRDGDRILGVIKGSAINQDGRSNGLTAPNGLSQQAVIRQALANANLSPAEISYIESHGTGTSLGDPIEVNSLKAVLGQEREQSCYLGSLKTNIGHLESAAGIASLIKTVLCLQHQAIPPNLHFKQLNPLIDLADTGITIPQQLQPWSTLGDTKYAGISSFGFGGTNAHVILGELSNTVGESRELGDLGNGENDKLPERPLHLLTLSAKSKPALKDLVLSYKDYLQDNPDIALGDICHTANTGRTHFNHRLAIAVKSKTQLQNKLANFSVGQLKGIAHGEASNSNQNQVAFLFTGQGSQYVNMGYQLYQTQPVFKKALDQCADILDSYLEKPLLEVLYPGNSSPHPSSLLDETVYTQPAIFAVEYALAQMWMDWGIKPSALIGHSVGEYVAATVAGVFSLADGLKLLATRGKLMQSSSHKGEMYAVFADETTVKSVIESFREQVAIAAINSHQSVVISGEETAVNSIISKFNPQKIKSKQLTVSHAFHSPLMNPILEDFAKVAESIEYNLPHIKLISNITGKTATAEIATAQYWIDHIVAPVRFADGMQALQQECNIFLEIGSKPILLGMGRSVLTNSKVTNYWLPSLRPRKKDWQQILQSLGSLYATGVEIDWHSFERGYNRQKVSLPTYPFQRESYWLAKKTNANSKVEVFLPSRDKSKFRQPDFYQINWQAYEGSLNKKTVAQENNQSWLIFADTNGLGEEIAAKLKQNSILISDRHIDSANLAQLFKQHQELAGIIYLTGLDNPESQTIAEINNYQQQQCTNVLNLLQALAQNSINAPVWLTTRGNQNIEHNLQSNTVASSCLWGLAQAIAIEHPKCWGGIVDLAIEPEADEVNSLLAVITNKNKEDRLALRQENIYVPRLSKTANIKPTRTVEIKDDAAYLITGGLGSLGLQVAQWLASKGAKNLLLLGRSKPSESAQQEINKLERQGVTVNIAQVDITDYDALKDIFKSQGEISNVSPSPQVSTSPLPIKGIIHAAGILDDGLLQGQTWARFEQVIAPKVTGAWNLHLCTQDIELDFFVLFSSVASLIGSPGQSNYSVANAGLDAIARYRQSQNLPALSINWGAWGESGMAVKQGVKIPGLDLINLQAGLAALEQLLTSELTQVGVISADWQQLSQKFAYLKESNYFSQLVSQLEDSNQSAENLIFPELLATEVARRPEYLTQYLQKAIAEILQIEADDLSVNSSLLDIGMDSLMVMEAINQLKTDLQLILYPREFYERPRIVNLAEYLAKEFTKTHEQAVKLTSKVRSQPKFNLLKDKLPPAAFILSSPRSGSTLLRVMLAGHSGLFSPPELHLLPFDNMTEREAQLGVSQLGEGLKRAFMALKGISAVESQALVAELTQENLSVAEAYQMLQQLAGDRLLIDKSPTYASNRETLTKAETIFNNAKYIHLVRHPYAVIESFARMRMDKLVGSVDGDAYQLAELIWRDSNQNIFDFAQDIDPERYHLVYYEDLVSKPQAVMTQICNFLEVPYHEAVLTPYQGDRLTDGVNDTAMSLGDPNFLNHQKIDAKLAETWQEIKLPSLLSTYTQQLASQLRYELLQEANADVVDLLMEETLITIRGLKICLCTWGPEEGPLVLCLHGILEQGAAWSEVAIRLAQKGYRVIAPDLRGHGRSDRLGKGVSYNLIDFLGDIDAIVENLAGRAFILVGHSLGSVLGAIFATIRPQSIRNIVLVETILPTANEDDDPTASLTNQLDSMAAPPEHLVFPNVEAAAERLRKATPAITHSLAMILAERITEPCEGGVRWRWEPLLRTRAGISLNSIGRSRYLKLLKKIKVPITLVYGDKSSFNRLEDLNQQHEAMPNATKVVVSGGHNLPLEAPSALAKIISSAVALTNKLIP